MKKLLMQISPMFLFASCLGGSSGGSSTSATIYSQDFSDTTVSNFSQLSGVAQKSRVWSDFIIAPAYAGGGDIKCVPGAPITVSMDVTLGGSTSNLIVDSTCGTNVELDIRRKMLSALDGHKVILEVAGGGDVGSDYVLDFSQVEGFRFDVPYATLEDEKTRNGVTRECFIDYTFNSATGSVSNNTKVTSYPNRSLESNEDANVDMGLSNPHAPNSSNGYSGCKSSSGEYRDASFRFKDGKIELDESGTNHFSAAGCAKRNANEVIIDYKENGDGSGNCPDVDYDSTYERWCVDNDLNGVCD